MSLPDSPSELSELVTHRFGASLAQLDPARARLAIDPRAAESSRAMCKHAEKRQAVESLSRRSNGYPDRDLTPSEKFRNWKYRENYDRSELRGYARGRRRRRELRRLLSEADPTRHEGKHPHVALALSGAVAVIAKGEPAIESAYEQALRVVRAFRHPRSEAQRRWRDAHKAVVALLRAVLALIRRESNGAALAAIARHTLRLLEAVGSVTTPRVIAQAEPPPSPLAVLAVSDLSTAPPARTGGRQNRRVLEVAA